MPDRRGYLLDTNAVSENRRGRPHPGFAAYVSTLDPSSLYISVLTIGELRKGAARKQMTDPIQADRIGAWIDILEADFSDRILNVDMPTARLWGELSADRTRPAIDTLLAATAIVHGLTVITRNGFDFRELPVKLVNPWLSST